LNNLPDRPFAQKAALACEELILSMQKTFPMAVRIGM